MKNRNLYEYLEALNSVSELKGVKFAFTVIKNKKKLEEELKNLEEAIKASEEFTSYENQRIQLCNVHSEKDDNGQPIIENNRFKIIDLNKFDEELNSLKANYLEIISDREKQINEYNQLLNEDCSLVLSKLNFEDLPQEITTQQLETIDFMINFD